MQIEQAHARIRNIVTGLRTFAAEPHSMKTPVI